MEKSILEDALKVYINLLKDDEFLKSQIVTKSDTGIQLQKEYTDFKMKCKNIYDEGVNYPDTYTDLQIRMIYWGLMKLKKLLDERIVDLNFEIAYSVKIFNVARFKVMSKELDDTMRDKSECDRLFLEFVNLYFDGNGKINR